MHSHGLRPHAFTYGTSYPPGVTPASDHSSACIATSLDIPGQTAPWTVSMTSSRSTETGRSKYATTTTTFDPESDALVATAFYVPFEIVSGTTCAPNCENSWKPGDPWPVGQPDSSQGGPIGGLSGAEYVVIITVPTIVGAILVCCCVGAFCCDCFRSPQLYWRSGKPQPARGGARTDESEREVERRSSQGGADKG